MRSKKERQARYDRFINGVLVGAGVMYLLDPDRGRRRRAVLRDQGVHLAHRTNDASGTTARDLRNRTKGVFSAARGHFRNDEADDRVIQARVRSRLGRLVSHPGAVQVEVDLGTVTLSGPVLSRELQRLIAGVARVKGVVGVRNELSVHDRAEGVPGLQGESRKPQNRPELLQDHWAPATRLLAGATGGGLTLLGIRSESRAGRLLAAAGIGLLSRAITNLELRRLVGVGAGRRAVDIHKIMTVHAPLHEVFDFWSNFENLPRFMSHLEEVRDLGGGRSRWVAEGPAGISVAWDAELTAFRYNELIAWKSIGTTPVGNAGIVRFQPIGDAATRIDVRLSYNPPAGALGHVIASIFGVDAKHALNEDLVRFKSLLENGKTTADGRVVTQEDLNFGRPVEIGSD